MLKNIKQFTLEYGIRNYVYLINPSLSRIENVALPRFSYYYYLEPDSDIEFPDRSMRMFNAIPRNKKVAIYNVDDLTRKEGIVSILDKKVPIKIKRWHLEHLKTFKRVDLLDTAFKDANNIGLINYNAIKHMYRYKENLYTPGFKFNNLYGTLVDTLNKALTLDLEINHIVPIKIPNIIPSYYVINKLINYNELKFNRIVTDYHLRFIIEIFKWLHTDTKEKSLLSPIAEEKSNQIYLELSYKGFVTYLNLSILKSLSKNSKLESKVKLSEEKIQKLFILALFKIQKNVEAILKGELNEEGEPITSSPMTTIGDSESETTPSENVTKVEDEESEVETNEDEEKEVINKVPTQKEDTQKKYEVKGVNKLDTQLDDTYIKNFDSTLDEELKLLEENARLTDSFFEEDVLKDETTNETEEGFHTQYSVEELQASLEDTNLEKELEEFKKKAKEFKSYSMTELKALEKLYEKRKALKSPYDPNTPIDFYTNIQEEDKVITKEETKLPVAIKHIEPTYAEEKINIFDKKYIEKVMKKDIVACIKHLENTGIIISDYQVEPIKDASGNYEIHRLSIKPLDGKESTITFKIPSVDDEGEMIVTGVKIRLRKQRTDLPIRKISETVVALTSSYGKLFINRVEKKAYNPYRQLHEAIEKDYLGDKKQITDLVPGNAFDNHRKFPNVLSYLSHYFKEVHFREFVLVLDLDRLKSYFKEEVLAPYLEKGTQYPCGYWKEDNGLLLMDDNENLYKIDRELGNFFELIGYDKAKEVKNFSQIKVLGDDLALGVAISYLIGLSKLVALRGISYKILEPLERYSASINSVILRFENKKLVLENLSKEDLLLFSGWSYFKDSIKNYPLESFDSKNVYLNILEDRGYSLKHLNELELLRSLFLDPITKDVLESIHEPTQFIPLLLRANELLKDFSYPDQNDPRYSRIRGYDRVPSLIYKSLAESIRSYKLGYNRSNKIELDPYKVWNTITMDNTKKLSEDINPILDLKEKEIVTLTGSDGLSKGAIPKFLRRYHEEDMGLISEATVDSSDVAVNSYLTPFAKLKDVRGLIDSNDKDYLEHPEKIFSTSVLLAPMTEYDDPKRINFINIQNGHIIFSHGYRQPILRTGYEYVVPFRVGKLYCIIAEDDGVLKEHTHKKITVQYSNMNKEVSYPIGVRYGQMEGTIYPHELICELKVGEKFKKGDYLAYNKNFFEKDWLDPKRLVLKFHRNVTTALAMTNEVFEDSSAISARISKEMTTEVIKDLHFFIDFKKNIINLVPIGKAVKPNDILFTLIDEGSDYTNLSQSTIELLQSIGSLSPRAKVDGIIDHYDIKYNGELSDMSPTLRKLAKMLDDKVREESKGTHYEIKNNRVGSDYRIDNINLNVDQLVLTIYIRVKINQAIGDKGVFANQMKSVISEVFHDEVYSESGEMIDAFFSYKGILNRIILSPILIGTTNRLIRHASRLAAQAYFGK